MAWFRVKLTEEEQRVVNEERESHPNPVVRRRMLALWLLHCGLTRVEAAKIAVVGRATVERVVEAFRDGGLDGLRQWNRKGPTSKLASYRDLIRESFEKEPVRSVAEAADRIEKMTGLRRGPTQVREFMKSLGMKWQCMRAVPLPPKKVSRNMLLSSRGFCKTS
jgi:transposase